MERDVHAYQPHHDQATDLFLTVSSYVDDAAVNASNTAAAGGIIILLANFALFFLLGPSEYSSVAKFLRTPWKYTSAARVTSKWFKRTKRRPTDGCVFRPFFFHIRSHACFAMSDHCEIAKFQTLYVAPQSPAPRKLETRN